VEVWADSQELGGAHRVGTLHAIPSRGSEVFSFEYDASWLSRSSIPDLDPAIQPVAGQQFAGDKRPTFGVFLDSSPDRWGRVLLQRREAQLAREAKRVERRLGELDYLLGVYDGHRMGALRFRIGGGPFLDDNAELASPPWTSLRELEQASLHLEREDAERDPKYAAWLRMLIAPGRSLGGARPKASIVDPKKALWLAKFPSANDDHDIGGWEGVVHALANAAGIATAPAKTQKFASQHHTFLTRRFDRSATGARIHFASAMTLLDKRDGDEPSSYMEIADVLMRRGAEAATDLEQLWRRIVFFICVSNVDDHLRNHGFLLGTRGWRLAPAYDMNPVPYGNGLLLNISETDNAQDLELALATAPTFRVKAKRAKQIVEEVMKAVRGWTAEARRRNLSKRESEQMAPAFRIVE
jgi:serine/threonine-protein kinase HipA